MRPYLREGSGDAYLRCQYGEGATQCFYDYGTGRPSDIQPQLASCPASAITTNDPDEWLPVPPVSPPGRRLQMRDGGVGNGQLDRRC